MQDQTPKTPSPQTPTVGFSLNETPGIDTLLIPVESKHQIVNDVKIRRLYLQASQQQWFAPHKLDYSQNIDMDPEHRKIWIQFMGIFYTLEKMGLNVIANMMPKAVRRLKSEEICYYLAVQCHDESRHVFAIESYLKKLGAPPKYDLKYHVLGQVASMGFYRVENWLFSTLFSENFASCFLRQTRNSKIDPLGAEMCKYLQIDESRHLHFLHLVLPDLMERLNLVGRTYVKGSQYFIMKFAELVSRSVAADAAKVGLNRDELLEDVFQNMERAYDGFGVHRRFLPFPKIVPTKVYSHA